MLFTFPLGALGLLFWIPVIIAAVYWIVALLLCIWVYKDAKKRDMNATVWLLIVLITGCIGCIIYLVVRD